MFCCSFIAGTPFCLCVFDNGKRAKRQKMPVPVPPPPLYGDCTFKCIGSVSERVGKFHNVVSCVANKADLFIATAFTHHYPESQ